MDGAPTPTLGPGTLIGGRYHLVRLIGSGGMGQVYEAEGPGKEAVALKALTSQNGWIDAQERARFLREAAVTSALKHPNVVPVLDHGIDETTQTPYLVMPLLAGEDLSAAIARLGPIDPEIALRLFVQACNGLAAAHHAGIVHRDVKPSNLFLVSGRAGGVTLKVCDFGLAKAFVEADSLTRSGAFLGTPHYVSPEQATDAKRVDARSDVWSLAMALYHALAGTPAYGHIETVVGLVFELTSGRVRHIQDVAPWIEPALARVIHGALLRDRDARCPSVVEFEKALSALLGDDTNLTMLSESALRSPPDAMRAHPAARAELPASWSEVSPAADEADDAGSLVGATVGGKYRLTRVVGRGGMGAIYEAHTDAGDAYAVKVMRPDVVKRGKDAMRRFVREARAAQAISSEHVTRVVDAGTDEKAGVPYIAMELLSGTDLGRLMKDKGALDPSAIVPVFAEACRGLAAAHALGIVHRDIKPANIFLHQLASGEVVTKLCDFGVAKHTLPGEVDDVSADLTRTGGLLGSPIYMSPEQAENAKNVDHRTDIYSLAITLHQALSGHRPWTGCSSMGELILAICTREVTPLSDIAPWVEPALAQVVHRALRRDVAGRYATADEFAEALAPFAKAARPTVDALVSVSAERRAVVSQPPAFAASVATSTADGQTSPTNGGRTRGARGKRVIGAVAGVALLGGAAVLVAKLTSQPAVPPARVAAPASAPVEPPVRSAEPTKASVTIHPASATVRVRGEPRDVVQGRVELSGKPGETFEIVVESAGVARPFTVAITNDGETLPGVLEVGSLAASGSVLYSGADAAASAQASARPAANVRVAPIETHATTAPSATTEPTAAPATSPSLPQLKKTW